jgi:hypothetical protein
VTEEEDLAAWVGPRLCKWVFKIKKIPRNVAKNVKEPGFELTTY